MFTSHLDSACKVVSRSRHSSHTAHGPPRGSFSRTDTSRPPAAACPHQFRATHSLRRPHQFDRALSVELRPATSRGCEPLREATVVSAAGPRSDLSASVERLDRWRLREAATGEGPRASARWKDRGGCGQSEKEGVSVALAVETCWAAWRNCSSPNAFRGQRSHLPPGRARSPPAAAAAAAAARPPQWPPNLRAAPSHVPAPPLNLQRQKTGGSKPSARAQQAPPSPGPLMRGGPRAPGTAGAPGPRLPERRKQQAWARFERVGAGRIRSSASLAHNPAIPVGFSGEKGGRADASYLSLSPSCTLRLLHSLGFDSLCFATGTEFQAAAPLEFRFPPRTIAPPGIVCVVSPSPLVSNLAIP